MTPTRRERPLVAQRVIRYLLAPAAAITLTAGCSTTPEPTKPIAAPATSTSPTPVAKQDYDSAQRLASALNQTGIPCINWERTADPINAEELGSCYVGDEQIVVAIFASHEDAAADPQSKADLMTALGGKLLSDINMVVGGNWTLSCDAAYLCSDIEKKFGGELVTIPA